MNDQTKTVGASALRHTITGGAAVMLGLWLGRKGVELPPEATQELADTAVGWALAGGAGAAGVLGGLIRRVLAR